MGSFYGGSRGASAQIFKTYNSYSEMETDFSSSDCSVGYNEYVIVNENDQSILYKKTFTTPEKIGSLMPNKDLKVMDLTAIKMLVDQDIDVRVFNMNDISNFYKIAKGEDIGTTILKG